MITYELMLLLRLMPKPELVSTLKRTADLIYSKGGIIRKLDNLGTRNLPYKISVHGVVYHKASQYLFEFNVPPTAINDISEEYGRDIDIIRRRIYKKNEAVIKECSLHEEMQPAPYREDVQKLVEKTKKYNRVGFQSRFQYNSGLDYYPFQK